jgi:beta-lactamase regulating signal transducer with metallopeptidase domain
MTLLTSWLWQGVLVAAITMVGLRCATRLNAASRYAIAWIGLGAVLLLPVASGLAAMVPVTAGPPSTAGVSLAPPVTPFILALPDWLAAIAVGVWAGSLIVGALRLAIGVQTIRRLRITSRPMSAARQAQLRHWPTVSRHGRPAELRVSPAVSGACAIGWLRPIVLVSDRLCEALTDDDLDRIVIHEYAHLSRYDDWTTLFQAVIEMIVGLHPAVRWLFRQIDLEREAACDDHVVSLTGDVRPYATCLTTVATVSRYRLDDALVPSATRSHSTLHARVVRLLDAGRRHGHRVQHGLVWSVGSALAIGVVVASQMSPMVVFLEAEATTTIEHTIVKEPPHPTAFARSETSNAPQRSPVPPTPASAERSSGRQIQAPTPLKAGAPLPDAARRPASDDESRGRGVTAPSADLAAKASPTLRTTNYELRAAVVQAAPAVESKPIPRTTAGDQANEDDSNPWVAGGQRAAAAGVAVGTSAKRAGTSIAGFFTRASKGLARSF